MPKESSTIKGNLTIFKAKYSKRGSISKAAGMLCLHVLLLIQTKTISKLEECLCLPFALQHNHDYQYFFTEH